MPEEEPEYPEDYRPLFEEPLLIGAGPREHPDPEDPHLYTVAVSNQRTTFLEPKEKVSWNWVKRSQERVNRAFEEKTKEQLRLKSEYKAKIAEAKIAEIYKRSLKRALQKANLCSPARASVARLTAAIASDREMDRLVKEARKQVLYDKASERKKSLARAKAAEEERLKPLKATEVYKKAYAREMKKYYDSLK
ncbi:MAG: hypothetical protein DRH08_15720 [Deltaproteobacteria bacterium]|nr:MAG: hypothetical protein DRH08_15720 [Deltaproteobacteria bacterium]